MNKNDNTNVINIDTTKTSSTIEGAVVTKPKSLEPNNFVLKHSDVEKKYGLNRIKIIKKDGTKEDYDVNKVVYAVKKYAARMLIEFNVK